LTSVIVVVTIARVPSVFKGLLTAILFVVFFRAAWTTDASPRVLIFRLGLKIIPSAARVLSLFGLFVGSGASKPLSPESVEMGIFPNEMLGFKAGKWLVFAEERKL
jgi:hypothetical protein